MTHAQLRALPIEPGHYVALADGRGRKPSILIYRHSVTARGGPLAVVWDGREECTVPLSAIRRARQSEVTKSDLWYHEEGKRLQGAGR